MSFSRLIFTFVVLSRLVASAQTAPPVPAAYQSLYSELQGDISSFSQTISSSWNGTAYPTAFASQALTANSDVGSTLVGPNYYSGAVSPELQELQALGVTAVTVHINFPILYEPYYGNQQTFQSYVSFYQQVAQQIHAMGMKMIVETTVASAAAGSNGAVYQPYYNGLSWNDYMTGRAQNAVNVAQLIQPDFMSVITEPDSESQNSGQATAGTPAGNLQELQTILAALQAANVNSVQIGAGAGTWINSFTTYIQNVISTPVSYVDVHLYSVSNSFPQNALTAANMAHAAGLQIAMTETWCKKVSAAQLQSIVGELNNQSVDALGTFSFWGPLDQQYLQTIVNMSQAGQFTFVSPFWTEFYYANLDYNVYGSQTTSQQMIAAQTAAGNARQTGAFVPLGPAWESMILPTRDTIAPQVPAPPTIGQVGQTIVQILWNPTTDNIGVAGYNLYRNGALLTTTSQVNYNDNAVSPATAYTYQLQAFDAAGNVSPLSTPATTTTLAPPDNTSPSAPASLKGTSPSDQQIVVTWSPSTDNVAVAGYHVFRGSSAGSLAIFASVTTNSFTDTAIAPKTTYYYAVQAFDPSYNYSAMSTTLAVTSLADTLPPTVPTNVVATGTGCQQVNLSWSASVDNMKLAGYSIYRGKTAASMTLVGSSTVTSFIDTTGLAPGTTYYYAIAAFDIYMNYSAQSSVTTAATLPDTQPPSVPTNLFASAKSGSQVNLTWTASTDKVMVYSYRIYRGTSAQSLSLIGSSVGPSYSDSANLKANQTYYYAVSATDSSGNSSAESTPVSVLNP